LKYLILSLLLCSAVSAQSITISGGNPSIIVSGSARSLAPVITAQDANKAGPEVEELLEEIEKLRQQVRRLEEQKPVARAAPVVAVAAAKPLFEIWTTQGCPPCMQMKSDIMSGKLHGVMVTENNGPPPFPGSGYPQCRINGQAFIGWNQNTLSQVRRIAGLDQQRPTATNVAPTVRRRLPVVNTQWGTIDLETYNRNCNCPMCQGIRALQQQYRQTSYVPPAQEPTPDLVLQDMIDLAKLSEQDVLADLGCGDGRVLIAAVKKYGCRGIGVEIDPEKADEARAEVYEAGLKGKIKIITGDALRFWPADHGVTAVTAYLYPELLEKLKPNLQQVGLVLTPFHEVPGLGMERKGDVWIYRK